MPISPPSFRTFNRPARRDKKRRAETARLFEPGAGDDYWLTFAGTVLEQSWPPTLPSMTLVPKHFVVPPPTPTPLDVLPKMLLRDRRIVAPGLAFTPVPLRESVFPSSSAFSPLVSSWNPTPPFFEMIVL